MSRLLEEPYRLFFPLGALAGAFGVGQWLLCALRLLDTCTSQGHAFVQIQAFLTSFACGFLFTMIPRRTQTRGPTHGELLLVSFLVALVTASSLFDQWAVAEASFLAILILLVRFVVSRIGQSEALKRPPNAFVLVPIGLMSGCVGALLVLLADFSLLDSWATPIGRGLIQEGMFLCLILGIGHLLFPAIMGIAELPDAEVSQPRRGRWIYVALGLSLLVSFPGQYLLGEEFGTPLGRHLGYGIRFALVTATMFAGIRAHHWPISPGLNRRLIWLAFWSLPVGLGLTAIFPGYKVAMLHVMFVGGFSLLVFSISSHVIAIHGERNNLTAQKPWQVWGFGALFLAAMLTRVTAELFRENFWVHIGGAAGAWILALIFWVAFLLPNLLPDPAQED